MAGFIPAIHVFLGLYATKTWMPDTRPGMTSLARKPNSIGCILSQTLRRRISTVSKDGHIGASWFETAQQERLLTMRDHS